MLLLFALVMPVLLLFSGLAIDVGMLENRATAMQQAADAAVLGAELESERGSGDFVEVGRKVAALNGFGEGANDAVISVQRQPSSGVFAGRNDAVEVILRHTAPTFFMQMISSAVPLSVRSVALIPPCVYLNGAANGVALSVQGSSMTGTCPIYLQGSGALEDGSQLSAMAIAVAGGFDLRGAVTPGATMNAPLLNDPLAGLVEPDVAACTTTNFNRSGGNVVLTPGVFCGGMTIQNATVQMAPGLYVIAGGAHWSNAIVQGTGITLFFTKTPGGSFGQFIIDHTSQVTLSAPKDASGGGVPALLVFGDRAWIPASPQDFQVSNATVHGDGVWYTTQTGLQISNSSIGGDHFFALETPSLALNGSTLTFTGDFSGVSTGNPFRVLGGLTE